MKIAVNYGADAVYCAGQSFGLRAAADNFTLEELKDGVEYAHARNCKVFVVLNGFLHDRDLEQLPEFVCYLQELSVDAVIVSDLGVVKTVAAHSTIPIHLSTQASCLNSDTALIWKKAGVTRLVLGRETTLEDAAKIKKESGLEVELFIHGSMCMAYSGHCVISNYTQGRDSNRGGCSHSCRHDYQITDAQGESRNSFFMSSKDLRGLELLPLFSHYQIDSLKIEGRMKGLLYAANSTRLYRQALTLLAQGAWDKQQAQHLEAELEKMSHRAYTQASLLSPAAPDSIFHDGETEFNDYECCGMVVSETATDLVIEVRAKFFAENEVELELLPFAGHAIKLSQLSLRNFSNQSIESTKPGSLVRIQRPSSEQSFVGQILRRFNPEVLGEKVSSSSQVVTL